MKKRKKIKRVAEIIEASAFGLLIGVAIVFNGMFVYKRKPEKDEINKR